MKLSTFAVAGAVLAASFSSALADGLWKNGDVLPIEQMQVRSTATVVEGRQATPVATEAAFHLTDAERHVIEQNRSHR